MRHIEIPSAGTASLEPGGLLIGGRWRPARRDRPIPVISPSSGAVIAQVADAAASDALAAVEAAADAAGA